MTDDSNSQFAVMVAKVESLIAQVSALVQEVRTDYVRKDLYDARHSALTRRVEAAEREVEELEADVKAKDKERRDFQRQIFAGLIVGLILLVASTSVSVILLLGGLK